MDATFVIAIATMGGLGLIFAAGLALADKKLRVKENPLIGKIAEVLPNANCGACGKAGCYDFATSVVNGESKANGCPVGGEEVAQQVATLMGVEAGASVKMVPRILCHGGNSEAVKKMTTYYGPLSCKAMDLVSGGDKLCTYGCLGGGDCVEACPFGAMVMGENGIPQVIEDLCTGCTMCVQACPRDIIEMHPIDRTVFVFCKNQDDPKTAKNVCSVACLGCGICSRKSEGSVDMHGFRAVVNHELLNEELIPFDKCRTGAIGRINGNGQSVSQSAE